MTAFNAQNPRYDARRDVRDHTHLIELLAARPQEGLLFPLVGTRRAGKTWALLALQAALNQGNEKKARYVDLTRYVDQLPETFSEDCLLIDEPELAGEGSRVRRSPEFLKWCLKMHEGGKTLLVAMTPAEWVALQQAGEPLKLVSPRELQFLRPLTESQAGLLARTDQAKRLLPRLDASWKKNPFLLELLFQVAEELGDKAESDLWELQRQVRDRSDDKEFFYFQTVYWNGLTEEQRTTLRKVAHAEKVPQSGLDLLERCGLISNQGTNPVLADPILAAKLCPLRIHHISDLHFGPKSAERVDMKEKGTHAEQIRSGLGGKYVRDEYLQYVAGLKSSAMAPHLLIVSGDIAEWADKTQYKEAREWLDALQKLLADHPRLDPNEPNVLLVGGNHDVDWRQTEGPAGAGARKRHMPFARAFNRVPRSKRVKLEQNPKTRKLAVARFVDLDVEVLLLGSAEFGGEVEKDPVKMQLQKLVKRLWKTALDKPDKAKSKALREHVSKLDPGLVNDTDLKKISEEKWSRSIRIAVLHHPVTPLPATEVGRFVGLINAGEVKDRLLEKGFCLLLHGHSHTGWFSKEQWLGRHEDRALWIASAPSLGSKEIQEHNGFNEIGISWTQKGGETTWSGTVQRYVREGKTWKPETRMQFGHGA
jgi:predicted MPP superfamily phosphohydrolase